MKSEVKVNLINLQRFENALKKKYVAKVGILKSNSRDDGFGNAELGAVHEFGSYSKNIPARSFLRVPLMNNGKKIIKSVEEKATEAFVNGDPKKAYRLLGIAGEGIVQNAFETSGNGNWAPLKKSTIARKGSSMPLIDSGQLRRSISSEVSIK